MHFWKEKHYPHLCQYIEIILIRGSVCGQLDGQSEKKGSYEKKVLCVPPRYSSRSPSMLVVYERGTGRIDATQP